MSNFEKLCDILSNLSESIVDVNISLNTNLINDLDFSSYKFIEMVIKIENTFDIEFDENNMNIDTLNLVKNLLNVIEEKSK